MAALTVWSESPAPRPDFFGCLAVQEGACLVEPGGLFLSVPADAGALTVDVRGTDPGTCPARVVSTTAPGGVGAEVRLPACDGATAVVIRGTNGAQWALPLAGSIGGVSARQWRRWAAAEDPTRAATELERASIHDSALALRDLLLARLRLRQARGTPGSPDYSIPVAATLKAWDAARARGDVREEMLAANLGLFVDVLASDELVALPDPLAARLDELEPSLARTELSAGDLAPPYYGAFTEAVLDRRAGRIDQALAVLEHADRVADAFPDAARADDGAQLRADLFAVVGQRGEAIRYHGARLRHLLASEAPDPDALAEAIEAYSWVVLDAREVGAPTDGALRGPDFEPVALLRRRIGARRCSEAALLNPCLNLARALHQAGDAPIAAATLEAVKAAALDGGARPEDRAWYWLTQGRVELSAGHLDAADRAFVTLLAESPRHTARLDLEWRALLGRARVALARGDDDAAAARFAEARERYAELTLWVPASLGRDAVAAEWRSAARAEVSLLIARGDEDEAIRVVRDVGRTLAISAWTARRLGDTGRAARWDQLQRRWYGLRAAQAELLAGSADASVVEVTKARDDSQKLLQEGLRLLDAALGGQRGEGYPLRTPTPGELILGWFELDSGWVAFAVTDHASRMVPVASAEDGGWTAPFDAEIAAAEQVTLLTGALPPGGEETPPTWRARPLVAQKATVYSLDLPRAAPGALPSARSFTVLVDPTGSVPTAADEAEAVSRWAGTRGLSASPVVPGSDPISATRAALATGDGFHFVGHAETSGLVLGAGGRLSWSAADTLLLPGAPPRWVYLSACGSGTPSRGEGLALGLAQAFVISGAEQVVATTANVPTATALRVTRSFYTPDGGGFSGDVRETAEALVRSLRELSDREATLFRLFVP